MKITKAMIGKAGKTVAKKQAAKAGKDKAADKAAPAGRNLGGLNAGYKTKSTTASRAKPARKKRK